MANSAPSSRKASATSTLSHRSSYDLDRFYTVAEDETRTLRDSIPDFGARNTRAVSWRVGQIIQIPLLRPHLDPTQHESPSGHVTFDTRHAGLVDVDLRCAIIIGVCTTRLLVLPIMSGEPEYHDVDQKAHKLIAIPVRNWDRRDVGSKHKSKVDQALYVKDNIRDEHGDLPWVPRLDDHVRLDQVESVEYSWPLRVNHELDEESTGLLIRMTRFVLGTMLYLPLNDQARMLEAAMANNFEEYAGKTKGVGKVQGTLKSKGTAATDPSRNKVKSGLAYQHPTQGGKSPRTLEAAMKATKEKDKAVKEQEKKQRESDKQAAKDKREKEKAQKQAEKDKKAKEKTQKEADKKAAQDEKERKKREAKEKEAKRIAGPDEVYSWKLPNGNYKCGHYFDTCLEKPPTCAHKGCCANGTKAKPAKAILTSGPDSPRVTQMNAADSPASSPEPPSALAKGKGKASGWVAVNSKSSNDNHKDVSQKAADGSNSPASSTDHDGDQNMSESSGRDDDDDNAPSLPLTTVRITRSGNSSRNNSTSAEGGQKSAKSAKPTPKSTSRKTSSKASDSIGISKKSKPGPIKTGDSKPRHNSTAPTAGSGARRSSTRSNAHSRSISKPSSSTTKAPLSPVSRDILDAATPQPSRPSKKRRIIVDSDDDDKTADSETLDAVPHPTLRIPASTLPAYQPNVALHQISTPESDIIPNLTMTQPENPASEYGDLNPPTRFRPFAAARPIKPPSSSMTTEPPTSLPDTSVAGDDDSNVWDLMNEAMGSNGNDDSVFGSSEGQTGGYAEDAGQSYNDVFANDGEGDEDDDDDAGEREIEDYGGGYGDDGDDY